MQTPDQTASEKPRQPPPQTLPDWELYHALREPWTHEDNLVNHRLVWLILSQGLPAVFATLWLLAVTGMIQAN